MAEVLIGGCLWGAVRYRITGAPVEALYCHCAMWRRGHGAPVVAWLTVPLNGSTVTAGEPAAYRSSARPASRPVSVSQQRCMIESTRS
jgi:hypothetical protein